MKHKTLYYIRSEIWDCISETAFRSQNHDGFAISERFNKKHTQANASSASFTNKKNNTSNILILNYIANTTVSSRVQ